MLCLLTNRKVSCAKIIDQERIIDHHHVGSPPLRMKITSLRSFKTIFTEIYVKHGLNSIATTREIKF